MEIADFPSKIAALRRRILSLDLDIEQLTQVVKLIENDVNRIVSFDSSLKNDRQRDVRKFDLLNKNTDYVRYSVELAECRTERDSLFITLELLQNQFSLLKLEQRRVIAVLAVSDE